MIRPPDFFGEGYAIKTISVIIPALNEEGTIAQVIEEIPKDLLESQGCCVGIVVVDNNSTDGTKRIAAAKGAKIIDEPIRGKGKAITTAFKSATEDFIFLLDADYTYPAIYLPQMLKVLEDYDVVLGSRLRGNMEKGAMTRMNRVGNHLLAFMANTLFRTRISDLCTGCWGLRSKVVKELKLDADGFDLEANLFAQIAKKGYRIAEVPISYRRRLTPSKLNSLKDGLIIGRTLIEKRFRS
ncbi:MAG TPA: glycosyltransferase family 2 protein [Dehalococcoidales bacterium]